MLIRVLSEMMLLVLVLLSLPDKQSITRLTLGQCTVCLGPQAEAI